MTGIRLILRSKNIVRYTVVSFLNRTFEERNLRWTIRKYVVILNIKFDFGLKYTMINVPYVLIAYKVIYVDL